MDTNQAVVMRDGVPHLELTAPFVTSVVRDGFKIYPALKPYKPQRLWKMMERVDPASLDDAAFFDEHFAFCWGLFSEIGADGIPVEASIEAQKQELEKRDNLPAKLLSISWSEANPHGGLLSCLRWVRPAASKTPRIGMVISSLLSTDDVIHGEVSTAYKNGSADPRDIREVKVQIAVHFDNETQTDRLAYRRATAGSDHPEIERLFGSLVRAIDGTLVAGVLCTKDNRDAWIKEVPYWFKFLALREKFDISRLKN